MDKLRSWEKNIKFGCWDHKNKKMYSEIVGIGWMALKEDGKRSINKIELVDDRGNYEVRFDIQNLKLLKYSGNKDIDGKDIIEGDILEYIFIFNGGYYYYLILVKNGTYKFYDRTLSGWFTYTIYYDSLKDELGCVDEGDIKMVSTLSDKKIIGNVYELFDDPKNFDIHKPLVDQLIEQRIEEIEKIEEFKDKVKIKVKERLGTGYIDRAGKEIYIGDILKIKDDLGTHLTMVRKNLDDKLIVTGIDYIKFLPEIRGKIRIVGNMDEELE